VPFPVEIVGAPGVDGTEFIFSDVVRAEGSELIGVAFVTTLNE
jgi:hypothetical protein